MVEIQESHGQQILKRQEEGSEEAPQGNATGLYCSWRE
jgi:hypothetical protein